MRRFIRATGDVWRAFPFGKAALVACLLGWGPWIGARGQQPGPLRLDPRLALTQYVHDTWQVDDGLPQSIVFDVLQGRNGYLWLATQEGLVRFDGVTFTVFDKATVPEMPHNVVRVLCETRDGALWAGTEGGLTRYQNGRFTSFSTEDGLPDNFVRALHEDRQGRLWAGTLGHGLAWFDGTRFVPFTPPGHALEGDAAVVLSIAEASDGTLWVGTANGVVLVKGGRAHPFRFNGTLPGRHVWSLHLDAPGDAWIGTEAGLGHFHEGRLDEVVGRGELRGQTITTIKRDPAGSLWIGTQNAGLLRLATGAPEAQLDVFDKQSGLTRNFVRSLLVDREGSLWIGTDSGGLNRLRPGKFVPVGPQEGLSHGVVLSVLEDRDGVLWAGTDGGGLNRIEGDRITHFDVAQGLANSYVYSLLETRDGVLWAGTRRGLCRLDRRGPARDAVHFTCYRQHDGLANDEVLSLAEDRHGTIWIGTLSGLSVLRGDRITPFAGDSLLTGSLVTSLLEDRAGNLWAGTYESGLFRIRGGEVRRYGVEHGLTNASILPLYEDTDGTFWVGLMDGGLCRYEADRFRCFTSADGLYNDKILQILDDGQGALWLGTQKGIFQVRKAELDAYAAGRRPRISSVVYSELDGLPHREMNGGVQPSAWRGRDGRLWFASIEGLAYIQPALIPRNQIPPPLMIESVHVNGEAVDVRPNLHFAPGSRDFSFRFTALSLAAPKQMSFQYWLEGYDTGWIDAGTRREGSYTNLPPGSYRFHVRASNNDGQWNDVGASFAFHIEPFFWQTPWFFALCALAVVGMGVSLYRWRVHHLRARQVELTLLVEEQTRELREREHALQELNANLACEVQRQLDVILTERRRYEGELIEAKERAEESARLKTAILRNMSHEIRTPITAILGFAHVLSEEVGKAQLEFVTYISENGRRLLNTLNSILDLAKLETDAVLLNLEPLDLGGVIQESINLLSPIARRKEILLRVALPPAPVLVQLDRNGIDRILQNLVGNAIKFTDAGEVVVSVEQRGAQAVLQVRDTGVGISDDFMPHVFEEFKQESAGLDRSHEGSGLGLAITRRLVEAMGGTIDVESRKQVGSTFTVAFPLFEPACERPAPALVATC